MIIKRYLQYSFLLILVLYLNPLFYIYISHVFLHVIFPPYIMNSTFRSKWKGRVALITGGGSGIGFEVARQFGLHGCKGKALGGQGIVGCTPSWEIPKNKPYIISGYLWVSYPQKIPILEDHPRTCKWLITMVCKSPK